MSYQLYQKTIKTMAFRFSEKTSLPVDDFISEGNMAYVNCLKFHNPKKGEFKPYLQSAVYNAMKVYANEFNPSRSLILVEDWAVIPSPLDHALFHDMINNLSEEAREVVNLVLDMPMELIEMAKSAQNKVTMRNITEYLSSKKWKQLKIRKAIKEIKEAL